jgi:two-component system cell cycle sensor histidine kinase/response regulator CckA
LRSARIDLSSPESAGNDGLLRAVALLLGLYVLVGGGVSFAGWALDIPRLTDWFNHGISIQPNPSVLLVLAGIALMLAQFGARWIVLALGAFLALVGGLTLLQYIVGADFGFNHQLTFGREWGGATTVTPGRMGPPASSSFLLIGTALVLLAIGHNQGDQPRVRRFVPVLGVAVSVIALFSLIGYLFQAQEFYSIPWLSAIALQTASMLMALAIGLIASVSEHQPMRLLREKSGAGAMARTVLPALIVLIPLVLYFRTRGQDLGLYDVGTGRALGITALILIAVPLMWIALLALRRHEQGVRDNETRYRTLFNVSIYGVITIDENGVIESANPAAERLFGYSVKELLGRNVDTLMPDPYKREHGSYLDNYRRTGVRKIIGIGREVVGRRKDGSEFPMDLAVTEFRIGDKRYFKGIVNDITERKHAEQERANRAAELEAALVKRTEEVANAEKALARTERMAAVGTLAAGLAHDINNLTLPLGMRLDPLLSSPQYPQEIKNELTPIAALVDHLRAMSRNLSLFARDPEKEGVAGSTDIAKWASAVRTLIDASVGKEIIIKWDCPEELPEVAVAPHRLTQAVQNLIHNACTAIAARSATGHMSEPPRGRITVEARAVHPQWNLPLVRIKVMDNGIGMSEEVKKHCLEPFYTTGDRPTEPGDNRGSGLGLSLVYELVQRAGGTIAIDSQLGPAPGNEQGTTIILTFPVARPASMPETASTRTLRHTPSQSFEKKPALGEPIDATIVVTNGVESPLPSSQALPA